MPTVGLLVLIALGSILVAERALAVEPAVESATMVPTAPGKAVTTQRTLRMCGRLFCIAGN